MSTIQENLQTIADSTAAIKQAIIDKGGEITGDITTWAEAIKNLSTSPIVTTINFTLASNTYKADKGMTWGDWVNSDYNPGMYRLGAESDEPPGPGGEIIYEITHMAGYKIYNSSNMKVYSNDVIEENGVYSQKK